MFCGLSAAWLARDEGIEPSRTFAAIEICHWGYGVGSISGFWRIVRGVPFDNKPVGRR
jgi:hypothetical protein